MNRLSVLIKLSGIYVRHFSLSKLLIIYINQLKFKNSLMKSKINTKVKMISCDRVDLIFRKGGLCHAMSCHVLCRIVFEVMYTAVGNNRVYRHGCFLR